MKIAVSAGLTNWSWLVTSMRVLLRSSPIRHLLNTSLATCSHNDRIVTAQAFEMALVGDVLLATIFRQTILVPSKAVCNSTIPDERVRQLRPFDQWGASHVLQQPATTVYHKGPPCLGRTWKHGNARSSGRIIIHFMITDSIGGPRGKCCFWFFKVT